ncbi:LysE/ArgO family amino acid transporter [Isoptericola variabilis]|uniref:Lysine exporter protein (LYSE/YGGA) n=1 Tax=Isoptericola variabilis (strain 225) TaxID=743718 RepID=F6FPZ2_ISOV2|nr:LysE/ArgO family amino acid transporter [Isoptericola variabilis]AEG43781.1 Lysine exporter protein (LYSE/YGGA) [Isoptericola variabilis 225]TWH27463.1 L-lysine exporter family protein LysE/ArgO [Isoptericola variabilis J7]
MLTFLAGLGFGLSLIVAIGAQNAFVLRQGVRREHVGVVVAICAASDAVLIAAGVGGLGALVQRAPTVVEVARWAGAAVVLGYGFLAARRAWKGSEQLVAAPAGAMPDAGRRLRPAVLTALALTWLNPHVYLDTVVLLGSISSTYGDARWWFGAGAVLASILWFSGIGYGGRLLAPLLARPGAWRVLDAVIAVIMLAVAVSLLTAR